MAYYNINLESGQSAYDLNLQNKMAAISDLKYLNKFIAESREYAKVPANVYIDAGKVVFRPYADGYGYTRFYNTAKEPRMLSFMSKTNILGYQVVGRIYYTDTWDIQKAEVTVWHRQSYSAAGVGYSFIFRTIDGQLIVYEITSTTAPSENGLMGPVYKCPYLIEFERQRELDRIAYEWIQKALPDDCPKTFTAYRSMKTRNSKGYQKLQQLAASMGRKI